MTHDEIKKIIRESDSEDWLYTASRGIWTYRWDVHLHIKRGEHDPTWKYDESWATKLHPNRKPHLQEYSIYYGATLVEEKLFVVVDAGRATMPGPILNTNIIKYDDYAVAKIIDGANTLVEYIERAGLKVQQRSMCNGEFKVTFEPLPGGNDLWARLKTIRDISNRFIQNHKEHMTMEEDRNCKTWRINIIFESQQDRATFIAAYRMIIGGFEELPY